MEYIEITEDNGLAAAVEKANHICIEPIRCHWDGTLFCEKPLEHNPVIDDLRFKLGFDHIELFNSIMVEKQSSRLITSIGNLKTLTMTFTFKLSDTIINGKIRICSVLNQPLESTYKLHLTKLTVKSIVGLYIAEDSYRVSHIIHELTDASMSLVYKKGTKMIPVYNKVQAKYIKHSLVQYVVANSTKNTIATIEEKLRSAFDLTSVSISLGNVFSYRDSFRLRAKKMKVVFNKLVDAIIDSTNSLLLNQESAIALPNISVILNFKKDLKKSLQTLKTSLTRLNFLLRPKSCSISLENNLVILYAPVDFADLNIEYKNFIIKYDEKEIRASDIQEHYKTEGSYMTISIRMLGNNKIDLNLLEFKITNITLLDSDQSNVDSSIRLWMQSILELKIVPVIEETFVKYLRTAMEHEKFTTLNFTNEQRLL